MNSTLHNTTHAKGGRKKVTQKNLFVGHLLLAKRVLKGIVKAKEKQETTIGSQK